MQLEIEKYRGNCSTYPQSIDSAGDDCANNEVGNSTTSQEGYYNLSVAHGTYPSTGNAYRIEADPTGAQVDDTDCDPLRITVSTANPKGLREPAGCW